MAIVHFTSRFARHFASQVGQKQYKDLILFSLDRANNFSTKFLCMILWYIIYVYVVYPYIIYMDIIYASMKQVMAKLEQKSGKIAFLDLNFFIASFILGQSR